MVVDAVAARSASCAVHAWAARVGASHGEVTRLLDMLGLGPARPVARDCARRELLDSLARNGGSVRAVAAELGVTEARAWGQVTNLRREVGVATVGELIGR